MKRAIVLIASTISWPLLQLAVFWLRFGAPPKALVIQSAVFLPMGFLGGIAAVVFLTLAKSTRQKRGVLWGYLAASPFAFLGGLVGGLFSVTFGPLLFGGIPLVIGCAVGFALGRSVRSA